MNKNDNTPHYRQCIEIAPRVTDTLFSLPCVLAIHKEDGRPVLSVLAVNTNCARPGQFLCEDMDGRWHVEDSMKEALRHTGL